MPRDGAIAFGDLLGDRLLVHDDWTVTMPRLARLVPNLVPVLVENQLFVVCCREPGAPVELAFELA